MDDISKQVGRAQRRLALQQFWGSVGWWLAGALLLAVPLIVAGRFWHFTRLPDWAWPAAMAVLGLAGGVVWAVLRRATPLDAAIEIDRRFRLRERLSSAVALSPQEQQSPAGQAVVEDARRHVVRLDVDTVFGLRPGRQLALPLAPGVLVVLALWLAWPAPARDDAARAAANATPSEQAHVEKPMQDLARRLEEQRKKAHDQSLEDAAELFKKLEEGVREAGKNPDRKEALVKLHDLAKQAEQRRKELAGADQALQQLRQLREFQKGPADKFAQAVSRGDLQKALDELRKLQSELAQNKLDAQQKEDLARQLDNMQKALEKVAQAHQAAQQNLQDQLAKAQKAGNQADAQKFRQQLDKLRAQGPHMDALKNLAQRFGQCAQCTRQGNQAGAQQALGDMQQALGQMQDKLDEMQMADAALEQLAQAQDQLTCPNCGGKGCPLCRGEGGGGDKEGQPGWADNAGGRAEGAMGRRPEKKTDTRLYDSHVRQQVGRGKAVVVGTAQGPNLKGNVDLQIQQGVVSVQKGATDPLTDQRMPKDQRRHAQEYFDRLREGE